MGEFDELLAHIEQQLNKMKRSLRGRKQEYERATHNAAQTARRSHEDRSQATAKKIHPDTPFRKSRGGDGG